MQNSTIKTAPSGVLNVTKGTAVALDELSPATVKTVAGIVAVFGKQYAPAVRGIGSLSATGYSASQVSTLLARARVAGAFPGLTQEGVNALAADKAAGFTVGLSVANVGFYARAAVILSKVGAPVSDTTAEWAYRLASRFGTREEEVLSTARGLLENGATPAEAFLSACKPIVLSIGAIESGDTDKVTPDKVTPAGKLLKAIGTYTAAAGKGERATAAERRALIVALTTAGLVDPATVSLKVYPGKAGQPASKNPGKRPRTLGLVSGNAKA